MIIIVSSIVLTFTILGIGLSLDLL